MLFINAATAQMYELKAICMGLLKHVYILMNTHMQTYIAYIAFAG